MQENVFNGVDVIPAYRLYRPFSAKLLPQEAIGELVFFDGVRPQTPPLRISIKSGNQFVQRNRAAI